MAKTKITEQLTQKLNAGFQLFSLPSQELSRVQQEFVDFGAATGVPVLAWNMFDKLTILYPTEKHAAENEAAAAIYKQLINAVNEPLAEDFPSLLYNIVTPENIDRIEIKTGVTITGKLPSRCVFLVFDAPNVIDAAMASRLCHLHSRQAFMCADGNAEYHWQIQHPIVFCQASATVQEDLTHIIEPLQLPLLAAPEIVSCCINFIDNSLRMADPDVQTGLEGTAGEELRIQIADVCRGLLDFQIKDVIAEAVLANKNKFSPACIETIRKYRAAKLNATGLVRVKDTNETFDDIGGLTALKNYLQKLLRPRPQTSIAKPKGVLLVGVAGCGKSMIARATGNSVKRLVLQSDMGSVVSSSYGGTEQNMRRLIEIMEGTGNCIWMLDEAEKMFAGVESSGKTDGGTTARAVGSFMQWSADRGPDSDVFLFATCNDIRSLPAAFYRAGRFNAIFYVGMPSPTAKRAMWEMYIKRYGLDPKQQRPDDTDWTGAEIANCCEQASILDCSLKEAVMYVTRTRRMSATEIEDLERWAEETQAIDAEVGGPFCRNRHSGGGLSVSNNGAGTKTRKFGGINPQNN